MDNDAASSILSALGNPGRLAVFRLMARHAPQPMRPSDIAETLGLKRNTASVYLSGLTQAGLLRHRREGTALYYELDGSQVGAFTDFLIGDCCRGRPELCSPLAARPLVLPLKVLFLCTGNSARSILAEALLARAGGSRFKVSSAGTQARQIRPETLTLLQREGFDTGAFHSKNLADLPDEGRSFDLVLTLCDMAADEDCPTLPGAPMSAHWALPDPQNASDFEQVFARLKTMCLQLAQLSLSEMTLLELQLELDRIGRES